MRKNQDSMKDKIDNHELDLSTKMSKNEVDDKLQSQFNQIVDHLQKALSSVESEEADFKCITDTLSKMCESLNTNKADKTEIISLRKQFIDKQVNIDGNGYNGIPLGGSTMDNEDILKMISGYTTRETVENMIQTKIQQQDYLSSRFEKMNLTVQSLQKFMNDIASLVTDDNNIKFKSRVKTYKKSSKSFEEMTKPLKNIQNDKND